MVPSIMRASTTRKILPLLLGTLISILCFRLLDPVAFSQFQQGLFHPSHSLGLKDPLGGSLPNLASISLSNLVPSSSSQSPRIAAQRLLGDTHVAVFDKEAFHEEVHGSVLWTLSQFPDVKISFYRPGWRWGFDKVLQSWWTPKPLDPKSFYEDLERDKTIRHIFLPTIDFSGKDWKDVSPYLQEIWEKRPPDERFNIIGMRHWGSYDLTQEVAWWAQRDAISFVTLGDHVSGWLTRQHNHRAADGNKFNQEQADGLRRMRIRTFVPVFPPDPHVDDKPVGEGKDQVVIDEEKTSLDRALIQSGQWDEGHRSMNSIFKELDEALTADPSIWGYTQDEEGNFVPDPESSTTPFRIKLLGAGGLGIPKPLKAIFTHERHLSYSKFFDRVHKADITLPAFGNEPYGENRASSTMGVSATGMTPLLVTKEVADSYGWFCPAYAVIRPDSVSEIEYIRRVRAGIIPWKSRKELKAELKECQEGWTTRNMLLLAELFATPPPPISP